LLNAILRTEKPIVSVEILNPFSYQEFTDAKQIILDVRARDSTGRWFNVDMHCSSGQIGSVGISAAESS